MALRMRRIPDSRLARVLIARRRLLSSIVCGVIVLFLLPSHLRAATRYLVAWDVVSGIYVAFAFWMIARSTTETCRRRAALYDQSDWAIIVLVVAAGAASFGAIFTELGVIKSKQLMLGASLIITAVTVILSWTFTHVIFTMHYANLYYRPADEGPAGGLHFPGERPPDYRDFLYYSFVIGCAAQTADVETESRAMRMASLAHGVVSFAFNTAILALTINIGASLLS